MFSDRGLLRSLQFALLATLALGAFAAKKAPTVPGKYEAWGPDIDSIEIVSPFRTADYARVVVEPLDTTAAPRPEDRDMQEKFDKSMTHATEQFLAGIRKGRADVTLQSTAADGRRAILIRGKVVTMDPGSRAKRMWVSYGAGAARVAVSGEIVDAASGKVLVRFTQERRSGFDRLGRGSSYEEILNRTMAAVGEDVANILKEF